MTQEVQPLTWQKRTNLEEHQQFFSKINEIIGNLAPTVDEAEQAIAQATAAIASANDAVATANAASAAASAAASQASAAASQAQTAATTVAGYDGRLTAAEGDINANTADITALQGRMGTAEGKITAIEGREADYLKKTGAAQTVTSQIMVPTTATGLRDAQIANGSRIQNDLAAYEPMVRTTGNQDIAGVKTFTTIARVKNANDSRTAVPASQVQTQPWQVIGGDDQQILFFQLLTNTDGSRVFVFNMFGTDGTRGRVDLMRISATGQVTFPWS